MPGRPLGAPGYGSSRSQARAAGPLPAVRTEGKVGGVLRTSTPLPAKYRPLIDTCQAYEEFTIPKIVIGMPFIEDTMKGFISMRGRKRLLIDMNPFVDLILTR